MTLAPRTGQLGLFAGGQHLAQYTHQRPVLQGGGDPFLVSQLLIDGFVSAVSALFDADVDPEARRQSLLEAHTHTQPDDSGEGAVGDGGGDVDDDGADVGVGRGRGLDADVGQVDDGQRAEGEGMLRVGDGRDEVCSGQAVGIAGLQGCREDWDAP